MYALYSFLLTLAALISTPYWLFRGIKQHKYFGTVSQRIGARLPELALPVRPIWLHAVSVGEVLAAKVLSAAIRNSRPEIPIVLSTVTMTGQALAKREVPYAAAHFYFPFDWAFCVRRFLRRIRPCEVVILETELWPNFLKECAAHGIPVVVANGRISDNSFKRYLRIRFITGKMLANVRVIGAQTEEDRRRFIALGAGQSQVRVTGNLKFDFAAPDPQSQKELLDEIRGALRIGPDTPVIVIGSTMKGEESLFLASFLSVRAAIPQARLILAPRHPERFEEVTDIIRRSGLRFIRRSGLAASTPHGAEILLLDSVGELRSVYRLASVAVMGGSFLPFGGHNPLEPAALGKAIVFGPEMFNFRGVAKLFLNAGAARQCSANELGDALISLLTDRSVSQALGRLALETLGENQGAAGNTSQLVLSELK